MEIIANMPDLCAFSISSVAVLNVLLLLGALRLGSFRSAIEIFTPRCMSGAKVVRQGPERTLDGSSNM